MTTLSSTLGFDSLGDITPTAALNRAPEAAVARFAAMRYGLFIHFGLYSLIGRHEWAMCYERIPPEEYRKLATRFNPANLDVSDWVRQAKDWGMRYMCFTTRHHDGFALFDSQVSSFNSVRSPLGRDLVREYVDACREAGLGVGLYYSIADWGDPGFIAGPGRDPAGWERFVDVAHRQLQELMTRYGKIDYLFYDGCPPPNTWRAAEINAEIRRLQPDIMISSRCGLDEDVISAEGHVISDPGSLWECCLTTNKSWGWNSADNEWKTPREAIMTFMTCLHNGGNFLLNIGPDGEGVVPLPAVELLDAVGGWVNRNAEAIFGTTPHPLDYADQKLSTGKGEIVYVPLHFYYGADTVVAGIGNKVQSVTLLGTGVSVAFEQIGDRLFLRSLPEEPWDAYLPIVAIKLMGEPLGIPTPLIAAAKY